MIPDPRPTIPTEKEIRDCGFSGDITRFPLTEDGYLKRCEQNGVEPKKPPSAAWYYAPNSYVQRDLNGWKNEGPVCMSHEGDDCRFCDGEGCVESFEQWKQRRWK